QAGLEGVLDGRWSLRVGYQVPLQDDQISGFAYFTAGAGLKFSSFSLDYAYVPFGSLGTSHRVSLAYQFDLPQRTVPVTVIQTLPAPVTEAPVPGARDLDLEFKIPAQDPALETGRQLEKEGKDAQAAQAYVEALKTDPQNNRLWGALGRLYYRLGKKDYAVQCFEKELRLEPKNQPLRDWLDRYKTR
ncbi:MAG TPA: tetratricopeptide repeat protein, partial [bacterium]|nr:tetratricopeptide repeat protein [bacterium]